MKKFLLARYYNYGKYNAIKVFIENENISMRFILKICVHITIDEFFSG